MKDFFVADAAKFDNAVVTSYFALSGLQVRDKKQGGEQYLALTLTDKTGSFDARMWEDFAEALEHCSEGCYVKVQGQISKYQGRFQITLNKIRHAAGERDRSGGLSAGDAVRRGGDVGGAARLCCGFCE